MRWLVLLLLAWLPLAPVSAKVFCYFLVNQEGNVISYREPPWDLSYPPKPMSPEDELKKELMGQLVISVVDSCQTTGKPFDEIKLADLQEQEEVYEEPEPPAQTESVDIPLDVPLDTPQTAEADDTGEAGAPPEDTPATATLKVFDEHEGAIIAAGLGVTKAVSLSDSGNVKVWNINTGNNELSFSGAEFNTLIVHDGKIVLGLDSMSDNVQIWNLNSGSLMTPLTGHEAKVMDLAAEGQYVASASLDNTVRLWNLSTGEEVRKAAISTSDNPTDNRGLQAVAMNLRNKHLAAASGNIIYAWDSNNAKLRTSWAATGVVNALAISGDILISASQDSGDIMMWDINTGKVKRLLSGHVSPARDLVVNGDRLISASEDGTLKVWQINRGELESTLAEHEDMVLSVATYGDSLVSGAKDQTLRVWQNYLQDAALQEAAQKAAEKAPLKPKGEDDLIEPANAVVADGGMASPATSPPTHEPWLALGEAHSCVILDSDLWCWGSNQNAQLGDGSTKRSAVPMKLDTLKQVSAIASHANSSCAIHSGGNLSCWGWEVIQSRQDYTPEAIAKLNNVRRIAVGAKHACALLQNRQIWCWGGNYNGQLGDGSTDDQAKPVRVAGVDNASDIALGAYHSCALVGGGKVMCWGKNFSGQLGNGEGGGDKIRVTEPTLVKNLSKVKQLTAGAEHTCALLANNSVECWGRNESGQLGNGNSGADSMSVVPVKVQNLHHVAVIAAGHSHTCAALQSGKARCWGNNRFGQIGNGAEGNENSPATPVDVVNVDEIKTIAAGKSHTCVIRQNDAVMCWGQNNKNQLTQAASPIQTTPITIKFDAGPVLEEVLQETSSAADSASDEEAMPPPTQTTEDIAKDAVAAVEKAKQKEQEKQETLKLFLGNWEVDKEKTLEASQKLDIYLKRGESPDAQTKWERWENTVNRLQTALQLKITDSDVVYIRPDRKNAVYTYKIDDYADKTLTMTTQQSDKNITIKLINEDGWMRFQASSTPQLNDILWKKQ
jgi:alpha-tubulin suppressor-like RCC1 family protein